MCSKILFLVPYPVGESPSQRFRFEQYFQILKENGFEFRIQSFLTSKNWRIFYEKGKGLNKSLTMVNGFTRRFLILFHIPFYNFIFIHRELCPVGPPVFEWIISHVFLKKIIYDFDDAIWLTDNQNESWLTGVIRWRSKVSSICRWAYKVSCGNDYLQAYAAQFTSHAVYNPTTIETEHWHNPTRFPASENKTQIRIGWTGSHSTLKYLNEIEPLLLRVNRDYPTVSFVVIANRKPELSVPTIEFIPWNEQTEITDLLSIDIGLMPLPDDEWTKGKCGFKALQYMALQIPCIASPVGVNIKIIQHGVNGFLCRQEDGWFETLATLIENKLLRERIGMEGRKTVVNRYSVFSNTPVFLSLFS